MHCAINVVILSYNPIIQMENVSLRLINQLHAKYLYTISSTTISALFPLYITHSWLAGRALLGKGGGRC